MDSVRRREDVRVLRARHDMRHHRFPDHLAYCRVRTNSTKKLLSCSLKVNYWGG